MMLTECPVPAWRRCEIWAVRERPNDSWALLVVFGVWLALALIVWRLHICRYGFLGFGVPPRKSGRRFL